VSSDYLGEISLGLEDWWAYSRGKKEEKPAVGFFDEDNKVCASSHPSLLANTDIESLAADLAYSSLDSFAFRRLGRASRAGRVHPYQRRYEAFFRTARAYLPFSRARRERD
jgi:hypothetical protein